MKNKFILLASLPTMLVTNANAQIVPDYTNPLYLPEKGGVLSDSRIQSERAEWDFGHSIHIDKGVYASEDITIGIGNGVAISGHLGNTFDVDYDGGRYNNDHNFDYGIGLKYNRRFGKLLTQMGVDYSAYDPQDYYGQSYGDYDENYNGRWEKYIGAYILFGYDACCTTPYASFAVNGNIDTDNNEQIYTWSAGIHKKWRKASIDFSVNYYFNKTLDYDGGDHNNEAVFFDADGNYFITDKFSIGVYGSYYLGGTGKRDVEYDYILGISAKVLF